MMAEHLEKIGFNKYAYDLVTAVPMHPCKLKERGYNQASLLGKKLANYFKIPFGDDIIYEKKYKVSQTKLDKKERETNIEGSFGVQCSLSGKRIIIVDDIFTTGCTLSECSSKLKEKGAKNITAITLAKTLI